MLCTRFFRFFRYLTFATLGEVIDRAGKQRLPGLSAEMAYNAMLALFPGILAVLTAIGFFENLQSTLQNLASDLSQLPPDEVRILLRGFVSDISVSKNQELFSISFLAAIWAFSGAISAAMAALDQINRIPPNQVRPFWQAKLVSIGLTLGTIILLLVACFLVFISDLLVRLVASHSCLIDPSQNCQLEPGLLRVWRLVRWPIALGIVATAFAFIYRYGASLWRRGTPIMPGAIVAAVSWAIISGLFRLYVSNFGHYNRTYGAVGAAIVLLLWLYMSSLMVLLGAQLNVVVGEAMRR